MQSLTSKLKTTQTLTSALSVVSQWLAINEQTISIGNIFVITKYLLDRYRIASNTERSLF